MAVNWVVAPALQTLLGQLNAAAPNRSRASDGSIGDEAHQNQGSDSDHNPHFVLDGQPMVTARDYTHDPANGLDCNKLAADLIASRDPRIKYIIWQGWIMDTRPQFSPWQWKPSSGHYQHLHLSVMPNASAADARPWSLPSFTLEEDILSALSPDEQREVLLGIRDMRQDFTTRYLNSGKTDSAGRALDRLGAMFPAIDNAWLLRQPGAVVPWTMTNAQVSQYRATFEQILPKLEAISAAVAQMSEDENSAVSLTPEQLAALQESNGAALAAEMQEVQERLAEQLRLAAEEEERRFAELVRKVADAETLDKAEVIEAMEEFFGRAVDVDGILGTPSTT